jgi:RNA polymerase sigma-70 factor (ECF subfamily)
MKGSEGGSSAERTNEQWLDALQGPEGAEALSDLRAILMRGLRYALADHAGVGEDALEDFVQDSMLKILASLDSFRGESRFTTWAQKIAVHVALTELRRHRWRDVSLDSVAGSPDSDFVPKTLADPSAGPETQALQDTLFETLRQLMAERLTDRQRLATTAVYLQGMPLEEVARRTGTSRNALYKLLHDARMRLRQGMIDRGLTAHDVLDALES